MGVMGRILGMGGAAERVGGAVTGVAEVFAGNRAAREAAEHASFQAVVAQAGKEFAQASTSRFDRFMNALNRLPRPTLVIATFGLFVYAMAAPGSFAVRMQSLALIPDPMWWLLGAIVSFYFGARELHYRRETTTFAPVAVPVAVPVPAPEPADLPTDPETSPIPPAFGRPVSVDPGEDVLDEPAASEPVRAMPAPLRAADPQFNAAIEEWRRLKA